MRRWFSICAVLAMALLLPRFAAAQVASVSGQILDESGKPWADLDVIIQNSDTGQKFAAKTDKTGHYAQLGVPAGNYKIVIYSQPDEAGQRFTYPMTATIHGGQDNDVSINFQKLVRANPDAEKEKSEEGKKFASTKENFDAGVAAMKDSEELRAQLGTASPDQKAAIAGKLSADYQTAITDFQQAEKAVGPKNIQAHATIWANLGEAYDYAGRSDDAVNAFQQAIALQPAVSYYTNLSKALASSAAEEKDPKVAEQKMADATADCDKAAALDPTANAEICYKNLGIILSNKGDAKDAIPLLQKATQANPKDAQVWLLLGNMLMGTTTTQQDDKGNMVFVVPPGTAEAFHKCIDTDPDGPNGQFAKQAKESLEALAQMTGSSLEVDTGKKKKK